HAGSFDITFLSTLPNFIIMAAADGSELIRMIKTAILIDDRPSSFRFPRGSAIGINKAEKLFHLEIGKGRIIQEGESIALVNFGARLEACKQSIKSLKLRDCNPTLMDARFAKPLDTVLLDKILDNHEFVITIEEGSIGGFSSSVLDYVHNKRKASTSSTIKNIIFPDKFIDHNTLENQYKELDMDAESISNKILSLISKEIIHLSNYTKK
ncbi:MAG: transketolase C-terminal domain-containing protein, partial [SAR202 cluster bacterium]|nr:transketolase C-terminal domain-containing protein [SAR202 cluster bacterium]